ncbi:unnamed protein product, partial [marine sediment metagenome]
KRESGIARVTFLKLGGLQPYYGTRENSKQYAA